MSKIWTIGALLQWTQAFFSRKGIDSPRLDAEILLAHVLQKERIYLYAHYDEPMVSQELDAYRGLVKQRADRFSVAHILGTKSFMGLDFSVSGDVLIPRPETEVLVEQVLEYAHKNPISVLDIGTGSGSILLSILHYVPGSSGTGVDMSPQALAVASKNGTALGLDGCVQWIESNLFDQVPLQAYDWVVSNPPYLTRADMEQLQPEVEHDPKMALFGGLDGLDFYRRMAQEAWRYLKEKGHCAVEIGAGQGDGVQRIFEAAGRYQIEKVVKDYGNIDRVLVFSKKA